MATKMKARLELLLASLTHELETDDMALHESQHIVVSTLYAAGTRGGVGET